MRGTMVRFCHHLQVFTQGSAQVSVSRAVERKQSCRALARAVDVKPYSSCRCPNQAVAAVLDNHQTGLQHANFSTVLNSRYFRVRNQNPSLWKFKDMQNCYYEKIVIQRFLQIVWVDIFGYKSGKSNLGGCENMDLAFTMFSGNLTLKRSLYNNVTTLRTSK